MTQTHTAGYMHVVSNKQPRMLLVTPGAARSSAQMSTPTFIPVGVVSLATHLKANGIEVRIVDLQLSNRSVLRDQIADFKPHLVGFGALTTSARDMLQLAGEMKNEFNSSVVFGGVHPTVRTPYVLRHPQVDYVIRGEGEATLVELLTAITSGGDWRGIQGLSYREGEQVVNNPPRSGCVDLEQQSFPSYALLATDMPKYIAFSAATPGFQNIEMIVSRGCPFCCSFCSVQAILGISWRAYQPERVVNEMEDLIRNYGVSRFYFKDSVFTINRRWLATFAREIIQRSLTVTWAANGRIDTFFRPTSSLNLDTEIIDLILQSGCRRLWFGIETGSPEIARILGKEINTQQTLLLLNHLRSVGIERSGYFMVGFPTETQADLERTVELAESLSLDDVHWHIFQPYPGTPLAEQLLAEGKLLEYEEAWPHMAFDQANFDFCLSKSEIAAAFKRICERFYGNP